MIERVTELINKLKRDRVILSQAEFAGKIGIKASQISEMLTGKRGISERTIHKIIEAFPAVNAGWLLNGEGEMIKQDAEKAIYAEDVGPFAAGKLIPLYDADAAAGNTYGVTIEPARQVEMIQIGGFLRESESALRVYGNSMIPHYPPGCIVGTREWHERFIEPGQVYLIETCENRFIKRLMYNNDKSAFRCLSDNTMKFDSGPAMGEFCYPEFEIPIEDVTRMHRVIGVIKRNII